jgi:glycosidase
VEPWLPGGEAASNNVADQRDDPGSVLRLSRDLISLRRARADLRSGSYATLEAPEGVWAWRRGDHTVVALNLTDADVDTSLGGGEVLVSTHRDRDGERIADDVRLHPWEALVIAQHPSD